MLAGPVVAGAVINALSWRWIFFLAVPLLLLTSILSAVLLPFAAAFAVPLYFQTVDGMPPGQAGWLSPHRGGHARRGAPGRKARRRLPSEGVL